MHGKNGLGAESFKDNLGNIILLKKNEIEDKNFFGKS